MGLLRDRFGGEAAAAMRSFSSSLEVDLGMLAEDIAGSTAHVRMLGEVGIIDSVEAETIVAGLASILAEFDSGAWVPTDAHEDIHMAIEARLIENQRGGRKSVQVTTSHALEPEALESIRATLDAAFPFTPILETRVDSSLIGGLVIQVDNTVYDSSLRTRMRQLRARLRERSLHEIQSGRDRFSHPAGD